MVEARVENPARKAGRFGVRAVAMNLWVYPLLVLWTATGMLCFPLAFALWKGITRWDGGRIMRHFIWIYGRVWLLIMSPFVKFRAEGMQHLDKEGKGILVVNHLSFFDTYCMALLPAHNVTFCVRAWPFRMPWYGWFMRLAGYLDVESSDWNQIDRAARNLFARGGYLLFFPEGHRSRDGRLQRFYNGAFRLAADTGASLVPLCLTGTDRLLPPGRFWLQPSAVVLRALPPITSTETGEDDPGRVLRKATKALMEAQLLQMRSEAA